MLQKPEVLAPVGDFERLISAVQYGADAVYLGGKAFGMRATPANFDEEELKRAVEYAHKHGVKVYLTCNTLPRNNEIENFPEYIRYAEQIGGSGFYWTTCQSFLSCPRRWSQPANSRALAVDSCGFKHYLSIKTLF